MKKSIVWAMFSVLVALLGDAAQACVSREVTPVSREQQWWKREAERLAFEVGQSRREVLLVGDSLGRRWPPEFQLALGGPFSNYSIVGDRVANALWRMQKIDLRKIEAQTVMLLIGTNDLTAKQTECQVANGILQLVNYVRRQTPDAKIVVVGLMPRGTDLTGSESEIRHVNAILAAHAKGYLFVDPYPAIRSACNGQVPCGLYDDDIHISAEGYRMLASEISQVAGKLAQ